MWQSSLKLAGCCGAAVPAPQMIVQLWANCRPARWATSGVDLCVDLCVDQCVDLCVDVCVDLCVDRVDLCVDLAVGLDGQLWTSEMGSRPNWQRLDCSVDQCVDLAVGLDDSAPARWAARSGGQADELPTASAELWIGQNPTNGWATVLAPQMAGQLGWLELWASLQMACVGHHQNWLGNLSNCRPSTNHFSQMAGQLWARRLCKRLGGPHK